MPEDQWCDIKVNLPFAQHNGIFRVDPANSSGLIILRKIALIEKTTERILFKGDAKNSFEECGVHGRTDHHIIGGCLVIRAYDEDPQILLPRQAKQTSMILEATIYYTSNIEEKAGELIDDYLQNDTKASLKSLTSRLLRTVKK